MRWFKRAGTPLPGRRDLTILAAGQLLSATGDAAAMVALLLRLRTAGSGWVAALLAAELAPYVLLAPVSGRLVDRIETRRVLIAALFGQAVAAVPLALLTSPLATVGFFLLLNALASFVRPATSALVPAIVGAADATRGYSRLATGTSVGWIAGPALGGVLTATVGGRSTLLVDAASFTALAALTMTIKARRPPQRRETPADGSPPERTRGGLAVLWHSPVLRVALIVSAVGTGCAVVDNVAAPFRFINQLRVSQFDYSLYLTLWAIGILIGVQLVNRVGPTRRARALALGNAVVGLGIAAIGLAPTLLVALLASVAGGVGNGVTNVTQNALIVDETAATEHGRTFAASGAVSQSAIGVGTISAAPLVAGLGAGHAMATAGTLAMVIAVLGLLLAPRRRPHRDGDGVG